MNALRNTRVSKVEIRGELYPYEYLGVLTTLNKEPSDTVARYEMMISSYEGYRAKLPYDIFVIQVGENLPYRSFYVMLCQNDNETLDDIADLDAEGRAHPK